MSRFPGVALGRFDARVQALGPWSSRLALFSAGAAATLALPPVGAWPVLYPCFWVLLRLADRAADPARGSRRAAFGVGWWFAFGYLSVGWYWIANALLVYSDRLWWMTPFAALGLPAAMAVYYGLATLAVRPLASGLARALGLAAAFVAADWLRGHLLTGFPWNVWGYAYADSAWLSQGAALFGVYGLGLLALVSATLAGASATPRATGRARAAALVGAAAIPLALGSFGAARLSTAPDPLIAAADGPGLRIVQAGVPQREKWPRRFAERNFNAHLDLSLKGRPDWVSSVVWPETAAAFFLADAPPARQAIAAVLPPGGVLLTGAPRRGDDPPGLRNSLLALDGSGAVIAHYDKAHLVPFGEYVPFAEWLPIEKIAEGGSGYVPGPGPRTLTLPGLPPVSPLICYEVIFPGAVTPEATRPAWILNLTNDAWYGETAGPYQHLQHTRMRAIERGLPLVRAANTGISAGFDGYGRELGRLGLNQAGALDLRLPPALETPTPFVRWGAGALAIGLAIVGLAALLADRRARRRAQP
ncbi:MAG: apolipoprotein N-acyltransferase [Marivibrio sp.]|uniref:apolipoprotein N-acyltransferase n=1 Tax=Marivibrio sp. TaxID=2039719 RepID=UPI0032EE6187